MLGGRRRVLRGGEGGLQCGRCLGRACPAAARGGAPLLPPRPGQHSVPPLTRPSHTHTHPHSPSLTLTRPHSPSHTLTHPYTRSLTPPHPDTPSHALTHPHSPSHALTHPHTPSHTLTRPTCPHTPHMPSHTLQVPSFYRLARDHTVFRTVREPAIFFLHFAVMGDRTESNCPVPAATSQPRVGRVTAPLTTAPPTAPHRNVAV